MKTVLLLVILVINTAVIAYGVYRADQIQARDTVILDRLSHLEKTMDQVSKETVGAVTRSLSEQSQQMLDNFMQDSKQTYESLNRQSQALNQELQKTAEELGPQAEDAMQILRESGDNLMAAIRQELQTINEKMNKQ